MQPFALGVLLIGAGVGVHLEEAAEVPLDDAMRMIALFAHALEDSSRARRAVVDDPMWSACASADRCIDQIRARLAADDVVLVRVIGGLKNVRLIVTRFRTDRAPSAIEADVPRDPNAWSDALSDLARRVFADDAPPATTSTFAITARALSPPARPKIPPATWISFGGGAAILAVGIGFGLASHHSRIESQRTDLTDREFDTLANRTQAFAIVADVLYAAAAACVSAGLVFLFASD